MGSGISITEEQAIYIIRRELNRVFREMETSRCIVSDDGVLLYETFDDEERHRANMKQLDEWLARSSSPRNPK